MVDDFQPDHDSNLDLHCTGPKGNHVAEIIKKERDISLGRTQLILCPYFFFYGTIEGGKGKEWPGTHQRKCSNIGDRVSHHMLTLGRYILHEYLHATELVQPPLKNAVVDHVYFFYQSRNLQDKDLAKSNADSYALFAAELTWTPKCDRDFAPPVEDNSPGLPATGAMASSSKSKGQRSRRDVQLHRRTPLPHKFGAHTPNTMREFKGVQENTYTTQQTEQFQQGHNDALMMCNIVIEEANANPPDRFDRIFREYFESADRQLVIGQYTVTATFGAS